MKRIRIGNDIHIEVALMDGETPFLAEGKDLHVWLNSTFNSVPVKDFGVSENKVAFDFPGSSQEFCSNYSVTIKVEEGDEVYLSDTPDIFKIVENSVLTGDEDIEENEDGTATSIVITIVGNIGGGSTANYNLLYNKPSINHVELKGNLTLDDLGIQPKGNYALRNEIPDTSKYVVKEEGKELSDNNFTDEYISAIEENTEAIEEIKNTDPRFLKYFETEASLKAAYPKPLPGDSAWVGTPYPGTIYVCETRGVWKNTGVAPDFSQTVILGDLSQGIGENRRTAMSQKAVSETVGLDTYPVFSNSKSYAVGETVNYNGLLYEFILDHAPGEWNVAEVLPTSLKEHIFKSFLSKTKEDVTSYLIKFLAGIVTDRITSRQYSLGALGSGLFVGLDENGDSYIEADRMLIRKVATFVQLLIQELKHVGGQIVLSPASMRCSRVEEYDTYYRCYFETTDGDRTINQEFAAGDQARCQTFNIKEGVNENVTNQYYWRLVTATGDNYIDLSKEDCDTGSTAPRAGDDIVQLGNRTDTTRQGAIVLSAYGTDSPSIKLYKGINSYQLTGKERLSLSPQAVNIIADMLKFTTGEEVASKGYVDGQVSASGEGVLQQVSAQLSVLEGEISSKVSATTFTQEKAAILSTAKGYANTAQSNAISTAASDATTKANNALASAKNDAAAKYATITTVSTMSTQISQLSNQISLKANSSTVTTLQSNLNTANSNITALQQRMSAAEVKITPDAIVSTVTSSGRLPYKKSLTIDATGLDQNKYYPVTIGGINSYYSTTIRVYRALGTTYGNPSWGNYASGGFSMTLRWSSNGFGWGTVSTIERVVHEFNYAFTSGNVSPVGSIGQMTNSSLEYVYVRGGSKYVFTLENSMMDVSSYAVTLHTTTYTVASQTLTSPVTSVTVPVVDLKTKQTAEQIKSQLVQTPEGFTFYGKVVDIKASILTAQNIAALNISTGNLTVTTGAKIGGWTVSGNSLVCTGQASAQLNVNISGTKFLRINNSSTLLDMRADGITAADIEVYGAGSKGLHVLCNASGNGVAIEAFGNCTFTARQNEEITFSGLVQMGALQLAYKRVNATYTCNWQDCFIEVSGSQTIYLPASPVDGRMIYIAKISGESYRVTINGNGKDIFRQGVRVSSFYTESSQVLLQFYYCQGYWMYLFLKSKY